jgi:erythromycin esterase
MDVQPNGRDAQQESEKTIIAWLQQNAMSIQHIAAGNGFADLQPLKQILREVKVVGLAETTHGTREIFQLKHRLLEFLVTEMNFNTFTIEASSAACQPINDYILYGKGDRATVLTGQWYVPWDTEEVSDMLDWLRAYNQSVPDEKKVQFHGLDITRNENARNAVLDYLRQVAPGRVAATKTLFAALAKEEAKWPMQIDDNCEKTLMQLLPQLQAVIDYLTANKDSFVNASSFQAFDQTLHYTLVMKQFIMANVVDLLPPSRPKNTARSGYMAENLIWLTHQANPDTKYIVWAHNSHLRVVDAAVDEPNMGSCLRETFGQSYFVFGFEFNQGSFQTRIRLPEKLFGDLKAVTLPPSPALSLSWYLSHTQREVFMLNLHVPLANVVVEQWLATPQPIHDVSWAYDDQAQDYLEMRSIQEYDGMIFIERTMASRPTVNAMKRVVKREGL